jgi:hypothetical protein
MIALFGYTLEEGQDSNPTEDSLYSKILMTVARRDFSGQGDNCMLATQNEIRCCAPANTRRS